MGEVKLVPLEQWFCDTCQNVIKSAKEGWIEWRTDKDGNASDFRICHQMMYSPLREKRGDEGCYQYGKVSKGDMHLNTFVGVRGMVEMLAWIDVGRALDPKGTAPTLRIGDIRNWADTFRRLQIPHYEEARRYFPKAYQDGEFADENEIGPFLKDRLIGIIHKYGP
jgi:hypothetical protein